DAPAPAARRPRRGRALRPRAHPGGQLTAGKARLGRAWLRALSACRLGGWVPLLGEGGWRCLHVSFAVLGEFRDAVSLIGDASSWWRWGCLVSPQRGAPVLRAGGA